MTERTWVYDWTGDPKLVAPCYRRDGSGHCELNYNLVCPGRIDGEGCCFQGSTPLVEGMELRPQPWMKCKVQYRGEFLSYEEWEQKYQKHDCKVDRFCFLED